MGCLYSVGGLILGLLLMAAAVFVIYIIFTILGPLLSSLTLTGQVIAAILFIIGLNVLAYFASFVWGKRKPWFFFVCLVLSILFCLLPVLL